MSSTTSNYDDRRWLQTLSIWMNHYAGISCCNNNSFGSTTSLSGLGDLGTNETMRLHFSSCGVFSFCLIPARNDSAVVFFGLNGVWCFRRKMSGGAYDVQD